LVVYSHHVVVVSQFAANLLQDGCYSKPNTLFLIDCLAAGIESLTTGNMKTDLLVLAVLVFASTAGAAEPVIYLASIAGKTKADVDAAIGSPTACIAAKQGRKCYYKKAGTSVTYIQNKADWITVEAPGQLQSASEVLPALGLSRTPPTSETLRASKWSHVNGILEIKASHVNGTIDYVAIKVKTP